MKVHWPYVVIGAILASQSIAFLFIAAWASDGMCETEPLDTNIRAAMIFGLLCGFASIGTLVTGILRADKRTNPDHPEP